MEKGFTNGIMVKFMMVNGCRDLSMEMACGKVRMVSHILGNGNCLRLMGTVFMFGKMGISTKESGKSV